MDLSVFYRGYREDGHGHPAFEPSMMVTLLLYAYCLGERSSRRIEHLCERDLGFRVVTVNQVPDHTTIARFRQEHQEELADLFTQVLRLCVEAGLVRCLPIRFWSSGDFGSLTRLWMLASRQPCATRTDCATDSRVAYLGTW